MFLREKIREFRKNAKLSQLGLSKKIGIPQTTLSDFENGKTEPTISNLLKIAEGLGVTINDFIAEKK
jgi:transcriptional regulator with XRE-family HTH domain